MVVAQLVERPIPIQCMRGKVLYAVNCVKKKKVKKKSPGTDHFNSVPGKRLALDIISLQNAVLTDGVGIQ